MWTWIRRLGVVLFALGGVWGAIRLVEMLAAQAVPDQKFDVWSTEGAFVTVPAGIVGALLGAVVGGLLLPRGKK